MLNLEFLSVTGLIMHSFNQKLVTGPLCFEAKSILLMRMVHWGHTAQGRNWSPV